MKNITAQQGAVLSQAVYGNENVDFIEPEGYIIAIDQNKNPITYNNSDIGLQLALYQNTSNGEYVIAVRGTELSAYGDWDTNVRMFVSTMADMLPSAFIQALQFIEPLVETYGLDSSNTSIVGHSMGGSIAQYLGSVKGFETLTYNAYGVGNMDLVPSSSHENITNYITMHDFVAPLFGSKMIGQTYMLQDENLTDVMGHGISNFTSESSWIRGYSPVDDPNAIDVIDGIGSSGLDSAYELALMLSEGREFAMINGSMDDVIYGGDIDNTLISGGGNDTLYSGKGDDTLKGGTDYDTYIAGNGDTIMDDDHKGIVYFEKEHLTGGVFNEEKGVYEGDGGEYTLLGDILTFKDNNGTLTIKNYHKDKHSLGITLKDPNNKPPNDMDNNGGDEHEPCPKPINPLFNLSFPLPTPKPKPVTSSGSYSGGSSHSGGSGGYSPRPSIPHSYTPPTPAPKIECVNTPQHHSAGKGGGGDSTGPIVLDLNRDSITSISLAASQALFDYDGDSVKENTAWIQSEDALLVNDKNSDNIINDASELFGNYTINSDGTYAKSGYQALYDYDSNNDNVIDNNDERFSELKLWIDANQDGVTNAGELKSLEEAGVSSLKLSQQEYLPQIEEGNTIVQQTSFIDTNGEGIMRDVLFSYENNSNPTGGVYFDMDANGIQEKMITWMSPNEWLVVKDLNGDGKITSGAEVVGNHMITSQGKKADTIQALKTFDSNNDGVIDEKDNSGLSFWTDRNYNGKTDVGELQSLGEAGAIQRIKLNPYQTLLSGYDSNHDGTINSSDRLSDYLYIQTNEDDSVTLYLPNSQDARDMIAGYKGNESIQTNEGEKTIRKILFYSGQMQLNNEVQGTDENDKIEGNKEANLLYGNDGRDIIDAQRGDDVISGGKGSDLLKGGSGSDTYLFNKGDGKDMIVDTAGSSDTVSFAEGISVEDIIIKSNGDDISVYLKEGDKPLSELSDQIIIKDWHNKDNRIEYISFNDGTTLDAKDIVRRFSTMLNDTVYGTSESDEIFGDKGDDTLIGRGGSDTYFFNKGDGKDTIIDSGGVDGIEFGDGITPDDLVLKGDGTNLYIGVKEDGKSFDELLQTITVKNWYNKNTRVEGIVFSDGTAWDVNDMVSHLGTDADDEIYGTERNDTLNGGVGDDVINAGGGDDTLHGGSGDDTLNGGAGSDTYIFNKGDGKDTISENTSDYFGRFKSDTLKFGEGITADDLVLTGDGTDLYIGIKEDGKSFDELNDTVTIRNWYSAQNRVEAIEFNDGTNWSVSDIVANMGTSEDDEIYGTELSERLNGGEGDDTLYGQNGGDIFDGGPGNDTLIGSYRNDIYLFGRGDGKDTVIDNNWYEHEVDILQFKEGITQEDIIVYQNGNDMVVGLREDGVSKENLTDTVTLKNWFDKYKRVQRFRFDDGTNLNSKEIIKLLGTELDDEIVTPSDLAVEIDLGEGDDSITTSYHNDTIKGGVGDDVIKAGSGDDTLEGGLGNDMLYGGNGNDIYLFGRGDGKDTIIDYSWSYNEVDTLQFKEGITQEDIIVYQNSDDMVVGLREDGVSKENLADNVTIKGWFNRHHSKKYRIENLVFTDGTNLGINEMIKLLGTEFDDDIVMPYDLAVDMDLGEGDDSITTASYADTIKGGIGDDTINTKGGNDTLEGGLGDDTLEGGYGDDTYIFNKGDGKDTIIDSGGVDGIEFGDGMTPDDLVLKGDGTNLYVAIKEEGKNFDKLSQKITIKDWYNPDKRIENITFNDGTVWSVDDIVSHIGMDSDDEIYGTEQNDTLNGGRGNDTLVGGEGNDTYIFNRGDGNDTVIDSGGVDKLVFKDISKDELKVSGTGDDLIIELKDDSDSVTIKDWVNSADRIEAFEFGDGTILDYTDMIDLMSTSGDDSILATQDDEVIDALEGDDIVYAGSGNDTINGGLGNDTLYGQKGNDRYIFSRGDGHDIIYEEAGGGTDTIVFGEDISENDLTAWVEDNDVILALKQDGVEDSELVDTVRIKNGFIGNTVEYVEFSDGNQVGLLDLHPLVKIEGTSEDDSLTGTVLNELFIGKEGNDTLSGKRGNDTYVFNRGDGNDTVIDTGGTDTVSFGKGITPDDLMIYKDSSNLVIALKEDGVNPENLSDSITIKSFYSDDNYKIEKLEFDDGTVIGSEGIEKLVTIYGTYGDDILRGTFKDDVLNSLAGDDNVMGYDGNDSYIFNKGDGKKTFVESGGNDKIIFGKGISKDDIVMTMKKTPLSEVIVSDNYSYYKDVKVLSNGNVVVASEGELNIFNKDGEVVVDSLRSEYSSYDDSIAVLDDGKFMVFKSIKNETTDYDIFVQKYDENGNKIGESVEVNSFKNNRQSDPKATMLNDGNLIVTWESYGQDGSYDGVYGQKMSVDGEKIGEEFQINTYTEGRQDSPSITALQDGGFIVSWHSFGQDGDRGGIYAQRYDGSVNPVGGEFQVNSYTDNPQYMPRVKELNNGDFVIIWHGEGNEGEDGIYAKHFNGNGEVIKEEFRIDTKLDDFPYEYDVTVLNDGSYVVTWEAWYDHDSDIKARIINPDGSFKSEVFIVNETLVDDQCVPSVTALPDGGFAVTYGNKYEHTAIRFFDAEGNAKTTEQYDNDLVISFKDNSDDEIVIKNVGDYRKIIEGFEFNDGSSLSFKNLDEQIDIQGDVDSSIFESEEITGTEGDDILDGGVEDDYLRGFGGNDRYIFGRGYGHDVINEDGSNSIDDTLEFKEGITIDDLVFKKDNRSLIIGLKEDGKSFEELSDTITIEKTFSLRNAIENFKFSDGTTLKFYELAKYGAFDGDDTFYGSSFNETINGSRGNDVLYGNEGDDVYLYNRGDGQDTISDHGGYYGSYTDGGNDTLKFGAGISTDDIVVKRYGNDFVVALQEDGVEFEELSDKITIKNNFYGDEIQDEFLIENFEFSDGVKLSLLELSGLQGTDNNDYIKPLFAGGYNVDAKAGNDEIRSSSYDDTLRGGYGNDTYIYNSNDGQDTIYDTQGYDTLRLESGIRSKDVVFKKAGDDLILSFPNDPLEAAGSEGEDIFVSRGDSSTVSVKGFEADDKVYLNDEELSTAKIIKGTGLQSDTVITTNDNEYYFKLQLSRPSGSITSTYLMLYAVKFDGSESHKLATYNYYSKKFTTNDVFGSNHPYTKPYDRYDKWKDTDFSNLRDQSIYVFSGNEQHGDSFEASIAMNYHGGDTNRYDNFQQLLTFEIDQDILNTIKDSGYYQPPLMVLDDYVGEPTFATAEEAATAEEISPESSNSVTIKDWFNPENRVEKIQFSDGTYFSDSHIMEYLQNNAVDIITGIGELNGTDKADVMIGSYYGDTITGGAGNDTLDGKDGDDTYIFNKGDGQDTIIDSRGRDTIQFGEGVTASDIIVKREGLNLILSNQTNEDSITVQNWFNDFERLHDYHEQYNSSIDYVKFINDELEDGLFLGVVGSVLQDGEEKNLGDINEIRGVYTNPDDPLSASYVGSELDEHIYGTYGTNTLEGRGGDDVIYALGESDIIIGGKGNDILLGGEGNDKYIFNKGDGQDIIFDSSGMDSIVFGEGISIDDIEAELIGDDLFIGLSQEGKSITELSDRMIVKRWDEDYYRYGVETLQLNDGTTYDIAQHFNIDVTEVAYPIVLDLNGNEITSTKLQDSNTYFDYDGDGNRERTAWIEAGDALLVQDINGDGKVTNGAEQFGEYTLMPDGSYATSGYEALSRYDSDGNGVIDANDENYDDLLLWKDTNRDGVSASDELSTLQENGISSINLQREDGSVYAQTTENGNILVNETAFEKDGSEGTIRDVGFVTNSDDSVEASDGEVADTGSFSESFEDIEIDNEIPVDSIEAMSDSDIDSFTLESRYTGSGLNGASAQTIFEGVGYKGTLSNVWLKSDTLDTRYSYDKEIDEEVQNLPESEGSGNVIGLQEAMNEQSELAQSVKEFQALSESGNLADFENDIDAILENWAMYDLEGKTVDTTPPIVLDLNKNGVTSTSLQNSNAYFDYDGDGRREKTAWIDEGDALLAVDLNGDGVITHGQEIFGEYSPIDDESNASNGYEAMKKYDTNGDNILDVNDENFSDLLVWNDSNLNGKNDEGELTSLSDNSITSINLADESITFEQFTEEGNTITNETNYTTDNGGEGLVRDVWFQYDSSDTIAYSNLSDSDEKKIAVVERFYGRRLNSEERNSVEVIAEVLNQYNALRYDTISKVITNKLYGEDFPNCTFLHDALNNTLGRVVGGVATTAETVLSVNLLASLLKKEHTSVLKDIYSDYFSDPTIAYLLKQSNIEISFNDGSTTGHIGNRYFGSESAENYDFSGKDGVRIYTSKGDDTVVGSEGIDVLIGGEGNDTLDGNAGNDVLEGGQGDDTLIGSDSQNVYLYAWGDGNDTIIDAGSKDNAPDTIRFTNLDISRVSIERIDDDMVIHIHDELGNKLDAFGRAFGSVTIKDGYDEGMIEHFYFKAERYDFYEVLAKAVSDTDYYFVKGDGEVSIEDNGGVDTLHFGEGITQDDVSVKVVENSMIIALNEEGVGFDDLKDKLTISNYQDAIEHFSFEDGTTISLNDMKLLSYSTENIEGDDSDQTIYGSDADELFDAKAGNDTIYGEGGDDLYLFGLGDGNDVIYDTSGNDTVMFKEGVDLESVQSQLVGDDLILTLEDGSSLKLSSWTNKETRIENIVDSQGNILDLSQTIVPTVHDTVYQSMEDDELQGSIEVQGSGELSYEVTQEPLHGAVELDTQNGTWKYTPNENYNGEDSFKVNVINEFGGAATSSVSLNIEAVNDAPEVDEAQKQITLANGTTANGSIDATDVEGDVLSYTFSSQPQNGSLQINDDGSWEYVANDSYLGEDSAVISISDGNGGTTQQTLNFTIAQELNQSPILDEETIGITLQDIRQTSGQIQATDPDGDILTYSVKTQPNNGTITVDEEGRWSYNVAGHYIGSDSAVISIDDGNGGVVEQTLNFDAKVSNPTIDDNTFELLEDEVSNNALAVDNPIGGVLIYEVVSSLINAEFSIDDNGAFIYTPNANYNGSDSIEIKVTNEYGLSATTTLEFEIEAVNDAPVANEDNVTTSENATLTISANDILANDIDVDIDDTLTITNVTTLSDKGSVSLKDNGDIVFETGSDFDYLAVGESETVALEYEIKDSAGEVSSSTITLTINGTNDAPEIISEIEPIITLQDTRETSGQIEVTDPDGDILTYSVKTQPNNGTITVDEEGRWSYNVAGHYIGSDSAVISIDDGNGGVVEQTLNFDAKVSNPTIDDNAFELLEDESSNGTLNVTNPVGGALTYEVISSSSNGSFNLNDEGAFTYTPNANYNGNDSVEIKVTNEYGLSTATTLDFAIEAVNDAPEVATPVENIDLVNIRQIDGSIDASDVDGDSLTYTVTSNVTHGEFSVDENGNYSYIADAHYNGNDSAVITVSDGNGGVVEKTLNFSRQGYIYEGSDLVINDSDGDSLSLEHINKSDLDFDQSGNDMLIHVQSDNATITLKDYFKNKSKGVDSLLTKQGSISLNKDVIESSNNFFFLFGYNNSSNSNTDTLIQGSSLIDCLQSGKGDDILFGGRGSDILYGNDGDDLLIGNSGNDKLYGGVGNDNLFGGSGKDRLYGNGGDDFLIGGQGNDYLKGGLGNDTYMFEKGDGVDTIDDSKPSTKFLWWNIEKPDGGEDTIAFGDSVSKEDISFYEKRGDLYLQYSDNDSIIIKNQDKKESQIEKVQLSDGNYLSHEDIELVIQNIHAYAQDNGIHRINNDTIRKNEELMQIVQSAWS